MKEKTSKPKQICFTIHADCRLYERLWLLWYSKKEVINDLKTGIRRIKQTRNDRYIMYWKLARYVVTKDKIIITILSYNT